MITLDLSGVTLDLGDRLAWVDEFDWHPVEQSIEYSTTGAMHVDVGVKQAGRPITLQGSETEAWITRELSTTLAAWEALPAAVFTLTLRGVARQVVFDHAQGGFIAQPVWRLLDGEETPDQLFVPTFRFLEA